MDEGADEPLSPPHPVWDEGLWHAALWERKWGRWTVWTYACGLSGHFQSDPKVLYAPFRSKAITCLGCLAGERDVR